MDRSPVSLTPATIMVEVGGTVATQPGAPALVVPAMSRPSFVLSTTCTPA